MGNTTSRKIAFEAQDNGVLSTFDRIKQSAEELSRELISEAKIQANSGKDQLKYIEEQIKAIEKRNKLDKERGVLNAMDNRDSASSGGGTKDVSKQEIAELNKIAREDALQTTLLRELLDAQRESILASADIDFQERAGRDTIPDSRSGGGAGSDEDSKDNKKDKGSSGGRDVEKDVDNVTTAAASNPIQAAVQALPFIGGALGIITALGSELDDARGNYRATTGYSGTKDANMSSYGMTTTEFLNQEAQLLRSQGEHHGKGTRELIQQGVSFGIDPGTLKQLVSTERSQIDTKTTAQSLDEMLAIFHKSNLFEIGPQSFVNVEEKIRFQSQLMEMQAGQMNYTKNDTAIRVQEAFGKVGGAFADQRAMGIIQNANQGLRNPDNEYKQAFLYNSLQKLKPGASLFELGEMQEQGAYGEGFMQQVMEDLVQQLGGREAIGGSKQLKDHFMTNVAGFFNQENWQAREMSESFLSGKTDFSRIGKDIDEKESQELKKNWRIDPGSPTGEVSQVLATIKDEMGELGVNLIDQTSKVVKDVMVGVEEKGVGGYIEEQMGKAADAIQQSFTTMIGDVTTSFKTGISDVVGEIKSSLPSFLGGSDPKTTSGKLPNIE